MKPIEFTIEALGRGEVEGAILVSGVADPETGRTLLRKGHRLRAEDARKLGALNGARLRAVALEPGDIDENTAANRLAAAICGPGVALGEPKQSQVHGRARHNGVTRVNAAALEQINSVEYMSVLTAYNDLPVAAGEQVAGVKVTPLAVPERLVAEAEAIARAAAPVLDVLPFRPQRVGVLVREQLNVKDREKFAGNLRQKLDWFGAELLGFQFVPPEPEAIAAALRRLLDQGATVVMVAAGNASDPLDANFLALPLAGARLEKLGSPAHPGTMFWMGRAGEVPIFGLGSCEMFSQKTVLDLILPRVMAGVRVGALDIARLGHGGVLNKRMAFRFPPYSVGPGCADEDAGEEE